MESLNINDNWVNNDLNKKLYLNNEEDFYSIKSKENTKTTIEKSCLILICITLIFLSTKDIYRQEKFDSRDKAFKKAKYFLESNIKGILLQNITNETIEYPIVSAVIPVYNSKDFISRAIKSIQNQNFTDLEIILVNDNSTDNTLSIIQEIQKGDPRIKIINNQKNMGVLYSRCIGVLASKSKYIFPLDNDDMFLDKDVFHTIINIADRGNYDIIEFKGIQTQNGDLDMLNNKIFDTYYAFHKLNLVLYQPQLGNFAISPGKNLDEYHVESGFLWAKCFRTRIYKKAIDKMGEERYTRRMVRHEDFLMNYVLFNTAQSYKFVGKYGILNVVRKTSASRKNLDNMDLVHIYFLDVAIAFVKDIKENKKVLVNFAMFLLSSKSIKETLKNETYQKLFYSSINKVLEMNNISNKFKNQIRKKMKELN